MSIFKAIAKKQNCSEKINIFFMYYFIHEFGVHYGKILDDITPSVFHENTNIDENLFLQNIVSYLNSNYTEIDWIGESKFNVHTYHIYELLKNIK